MIELIKHIILCVTAAALLGAILLTLTEHGAQREIIRIAIGLMLVLALVTPLRTVQLPTLSLSSFTDWIAPENSSTDEDGYSQAVLTEFCSQTEQYLQQLGAQQGIDCTVTVLAEQREDAVVTIRSAVVVVHSDATEEQVQEFRETVCQQLDLTQEAVSMQ